MKALVLHDNKILKYHDVDKPQKRFEKDVIVKVKACGICGSDIARGFGGKAYHYPLIMGHEFSGIVDESFEGCQYRKGDYVVVFPLIPCRKCKSCQTGDFAQCFNYSYYGSRCDGGFAQYVVVPEKNLFKVPDHVDLLHAALTEPAAVALHGVRQTTAKLGATAVVYGCGPIGNMTAQWLKIAGCSAVYVVDIDPLKLNIAREMGFITINSLEKDPVKFIEEQTNGSGVSIAIEAVGLPETFLNTVRSVGRMGEVVFIGNIQGTFKIYEKDFSNLLRKQVKIYCTWNSKIVPRGIDDWSTVLNMMDRELLVSQLISHRPKLKEGAQVFDEMVNKRHSFNKVVFEIE